MAVAATALAAAQLSFACTGITLRTAKGNTVTARTIEWAASDMNSLYVVVPRGYTSQSMTPDGATGMRFKTKYGYVGLAVEQSDFVTEGLNEKGLSAGLFYFPEYGKYEPYSKENASRSIADMQLVSYILGTCATVDEVKEAVSGIKIHPIDPRASTIHWRFTEESGRQIVLEIIDQKCIFYENELGVLTNSPSLDWHLTNLNNYVNLTSGAVSEGKAGRLALKSLGGGSGFHGIPGDFTPPSRFVRAAFFQCTAPVLKTSEETVFQAFHLLNNFDLPIGAQTNEGVTPPDMPSATQFTSATDLSEKKIYIKTMYNSHIRCVDLNRINFSKCKFINELLDPQRKEPVEPLFRH